MKAEDLRPGKTYVGRNGRRRYVRAIAVDRAGRRFVAYDVPQGGEYSCTVSCFASWAEREATPAETTP